MKFTWLHQGEPKASFTRTVNVIVFTRGTLNLFDVVCKQHNRTVLKSFLNDTKKLMLTVSVSGPLRTPLYSYDVEAPEESFSQLVEQLSIKSRPKTVYAHKIRK